MKPVRTQWFDAIEHDPMYVGRYLVKRTHSKPVFRWWNGAAWQYNRRKEATPAMFGNRPGDVWAGVADKQQSATPSRMTLRQRHAIDINRLGA
jgi:hypothetical protein